MTGLVDTAVVLLNVKYEFIAIPLIASFLIVLNVGEVGLSDAKQWYLGDLYYGIQLTIGIICRIRKEKILIVYSSLPFFLQKITNIYIFVMILAIVLLLK